DPALLVTHPARLRAGRRGLGLGMRLSDGALVAGKAGALPGRRHAPRSDHGWSGRARGIASHALQPAIGRHTHGPRSRRFAASRCAGRTRAQPAAAVDGCSRTAGSVIAKQLPTPASVSTVRVPSKLCSIRWRAIESPRPVPRVGSLVVNSSSKIFGSAAAGMPPAQSRTVRTALAPAWRAWISMRPPLMPASSYASSALVTRLINTWPRRAGSPWSVTRLSSPKSRRRVHLVRDPGRQPAERRQPLGAHEARLVALQLLVGGAQLGERAPEVRVRLRERGGPLLYLLFEAGVQALEPREGAGVGHRQRDLARRRAQEGGVVHGVGTPRALAPEGERPHRRSAAADRHEQLGAEGMPDGRDRPPAAVVPLVAGEDLPPLDALRQRRRQRELHGPAVALPGPQELAPRLPQEGRGRGGAHRGRHD